MPVDPGTPSEPPPPPPTGPPMPEVVEYLTEWRDSLPSSSWWRPVFTLIIQVMTAGSA